MVTKATESAGHTGYVAYKIVRERVTDPGAIPGMSTMKLTDLNPTREARGGYTHLAFDCPKCAGHRIEVPLPPHPRAWKVEDPTYENMTLSPSILHSTGYADGMDNPSRFCESHFFIRGGEIQMA